jgi:hypothetical protein
MCATSTFPHRTHEPRRRYGANIDGTSIDGGPADGSSMDCGTTDGPLPGDRPDGSACTGDACPCHSNADCSAPPSYIRPGDPVDGGSCNNDARMRQVRFRRDGVRAGRLQLRPG